MEVFALSTGALSSRENDPKDVRARNLEKKQFSL